MNKAEQFRWAGGVGESKTGKHYLVLPFQYKTDLKKAAQKLNMEILKKLRYQVTLQ